jgi:FkbM family methyltransferase
MTIKSFVGNLIRRKLNKFLYMGSDDYSQLGEQMVVMNILGRMDQSKMNPIYVDIGAFHPFKGSNTYKLYLKNWRGVVVDPNPNKIKQFAPVRPLDICLTNAVVPDSWDMKEVEMLATGSHDARESITPTLNKNNHLDKETAQHSYIAKTIKASEVLELCCKELGMPAFLSVDIEGLEGDLIKGTNFKKYPIPVLCIEHFLSEFTESQSIFDYKSSPMIQHLEANGYELVSVCGVSVVLAHKDFYVPFG